MASPFKFLDAYTRDDRDQFFGRGEETAQLYELVNQNRLVLLYGPSGTGKTSLIQCGLGNRFEATDWLPLFVRRGTHLPTSLQKALTDHWDEKLEAPFWQIDDNPLPRIIEDLFAEYLRPVYLIFDQLEEIFILGDEEERRIFTQAMSDIYHAKLPCRLIFILREEYLAHLYDFEQRIPTLFKRRLRVEAMSAQQAEEVVLRSCERFNIRLEAPEYNPAQIVSKVSSGRSGVALPYLQVYLDRLYREDFARTYPKGHAGGKQQGKWPELEFTTAEIDAFGEIGDVLKAFLQEQTQAIQADLKDRFKLPDRAVRKVLNAFATLQGTKIPQIRKELKVPPLKEDQLDAILDRLRQARILREEDGTYELAHDTLAGEIASQRSGAEQALLEISELIHNRYRAFPRTQTHLDARELQLIATYENQLREEQKIGEDEWRFITESQHEVLRKKRRTNRITAGVIGGLSLLAIAALWQWQVAVGAQAEAETKEKEAIASRDTARQATEAAEKALLEAQTERLKAQKALAGSYEAQLKVLQSDLSEAIDQVNSGMTSSLPQAMLRSRINTRNRIQLQKNSMELKLDSLNQEIEKNQTLQP